MVPNEDQHSYRGLELAILAGAFVLGTVMSALGSILPALFVAIGFEKADAGRLFLIMNFMMLVSSMIFGPVCDRFGFKAFLITSTILAGAAFASMALSHSYEQITGSLILLGLGGGGLNGGLNALLSDISSRRRTSALNRLGIYFGCGALFTPFAVAGLLDRLGLSFILTGLAALTVVPLVLFFTVRYPVEKHEGGFKASELSAVLRSPILYLFGFLLLFQSGNEFTMGGWISTYLGERFHLPGGTASLILAGYWLALMLGRVAASRIAGKLSPGNVVLASAFIALVGSSGLIFTFSLPAAVLFVGAVGFGFAAIFPTTLAQAGTAYPQFSGTVFGVLFAMALCGGMTAPWLAGRIAQDHGVGAGFWLTAGSCASIVVLQWLIRKKMRAA